MYHYIDEVPVFPKLPYLCYYDFWSWRQLHPLVLDLPPEASDKPRDWYQISLILRVQEMQTNSMKTFRPPKYYDRYDSIGYGFFWKTGTMTSYNNQEWYEVKGYWHGVSDGTGQEIVATNDFISFRGLIPISSPDYTFDYQYINGILQIVYPILILEAKGLIQTVYVVRSKKDHKPGDYSDID